MTTLLQNKRSLVVSDNSGRINVKPKAQEDVKNAVLSFLDSSTTATGRSTYYNTKEEQMEALSATHDAIFYSNRGLYAAMLALPGVTDLSKQLGIERLLKNKFGIQDSFLSVDQEKLVIDYLANNMPVTRLLKMFQTIRKNRINNSRTRKLILRFILGSNKLPFWSVKYRKKLREALTHAWGKSTTTFVRETLKLPASRRKASAKRKLKKLINNHVSSNSNLKEKDVYQCVYFVLGGKNKRYTVKELKSYVDAQKDIEKGKDLPREVLEGIRSVFHPDVDSSHVLDITKHTMTQSDKLSSQRSANKRGVKIDFDPKAQDIVKLYIYALEREEELKNKDKEEIREALDEKARKIARTYPVSYRNVGIILDTSHSMFGTAKQKRRPMAIALAMRDVLGFTSTENTFIVNTGGDVDRFGFVQPEGETELAKSIVDVLSNDVDVVYLITDGYENAPAGRVDEVISQLRELDIETPIYQITPVMASESVGKKGSVRQLSKQIEPMTVSSPAAIGMGLIRSAISNDLENGLESLMRLVKPLIKK